MSMSAAQSSAFLTAAGFKPLAIYTLFVGFTVGITFLWAAWAIYSCYRGWATGNLDGAIALPSAVRASMLCIIVSLFVLS